jgi:hypothetical protein
LSTFIDLFEKLSLRGSYVGGAFQRLVAAEYALAPATDPEAIKLYPILAQKVVQQQKQLGTKFNFINTMEDPYGSMKQLTKSIKGQQQQGVKKPDVKVFAAPPMGGHPALSNDQNTMLRGVHDIIAHYYGQHPFSARGEYAAYNRHLKTLPRAVAPILFTEIVGQTSFYKIYGDYTTQKAAFLPDFDPFNVGQLSPQSKLNQWFVLENKVLRPVPGFKWEEFKRTFPAIASELSSQPKFNPAEWENYDAGADPSVTRKTTMFGAQ